ncbi:MAG: ABC transporter ATP-binding protein [Pseudomonadota bacterium]
MDRDKALNTKKPWISPARWGGGKPAGVVIASEMSLEGISYASGGKQILEDVSIHVAPGEVLCLLGPSGSGKTTLLKIAAGLIEGASGSISLDKKIIADSRHFLPPEKRGIGLVFQDYALFPHLTIRQNVEYGLTSMGRTEARKQAERVLSRVGLADRAEQYPDVLSGGEQQRVALARALAPRPGILLMDEPFSGLDSRLRDAVREESLGLLRETRSTAIIVTHDAEEALRVGDKIALLRDGTLVQHGTGHDLYYSPCNLFAASFFSEVNVVPIECRDNEAHSVFGSHPMNGVEDPVNEGAIRHTDVVLSPYVPGNPGLPGRVVSKRFLGTSELLDVKVEGLDRPLQARSRPGKIQKSGDAVLISVDPKAMMIFPSGGN